MQYIELSRNERRVLWTCALSTERPKGMLTEAYLDALDDLEDKDLIIVTRSRENITAIELTERGERYLKNNPELRNPINWQWATQTALLIIITVAVIANLIL